MFFLKKDDTRIGFIGAGRVASAFARRLKDAGHQVVAISSRRDATARRLAALVPNAMATSAQGVADTADLVFITTPDSAIREVAESVRWRRGQYVVHTSGAESLDVLGAPIAAGAVAGSLHPLQTFADAETAMANLPGSVFAIEAEGTLRDLLTRIVQSLRGTPVYVRSEDRALYHAAAVLVSNYTVTLAKLATDLWLRMGVDRPTALKALLPLLQGTVNNLGAVGLPAALTGPVARGDVETVRRHLAALREAAPEFVAVYRELALQTIPVALAKGGLEESAAHELRQLLESYQESVSPGGSSQ